ncbi:WD40 repeat-like protein [Hortaea werneckii]|nr:WD40 repeat-like protein [Hortaea werneckii]KAI7311640.1 WD40 repeat-like protein [Hortaea werneckii]
MTQNQALAQSPTHPPLQPSYILRGHTAQVHSVLFLRENLRLLSGDADGWVVLWDVPIKRPVVVWRAHKSTILGLGSWGEGKIITHGRDSKLCVWQLQEDDGMIYSKVLPVDDATTDRKQPLQLHTLMVNTLNFCSFAMCHAPSAAETPNNETPTPPSIHLAYPGVQDGQIIVTDLPSEARIATIPEPKDIKTGMVMAIRLDYNHERDLTIVGGYESGHACVWRRNPSSQYWERIYTYQAHSQPILSLDLAISLGSFFTSSADAIIARHPLSSAESETKVIQTGHAGQQGLTIRSDRKIFATAGWDGKGRVYSAKTMKELAVLKWHKEGCYALAFAATDLNESYESDQNPNTGLVKRGMTVSEQRTSAAKSTHWLAVGSKDGKISLWDIY